MVHTANKKEKQMSKYNKNKFAIKLKKLKELRLQKMEKQLLDDTLKGYDHYFFINERGKAQVVTEQGRWVVEHIKTAILKFNYQVDKVNKMQMKDFTEEEKQAYIKKYES